MAETAKPGPLGSLTWEYLAKRFFLKEPPPENQFFWPLQWKAGTKPGPAYPIDDEIFRLLDPKGLGVRLDMAELGAKGIVCPYHTVRRRLVLVPQIVDLVTKGTEDGRQATSRFSASATRAEKLVKSAQRVREAICALQSETSGLGDELRSLTWSAGHPRPGFARRDHDAGNVLRSTINRQRDDLLGVSDALMAITEQFDKQYAAIEKSALEIAPAFKSEASRLKPLKADTKVEEFAFIEHIGFTWTDLTGSVPSSSSSSFVGFVDAAYQSLWDKPPAVKDWGYLCRAGLKRIKLRPHWDRLDRYEKKLRPPGTRTISAEEYKRELREREARWLEKAREAVRVCRHWHPLLQSPDDEERERAKRGFSEAMLTIWSAEGREVREYLNSEGFSVQSVADLLAKGAL